MDDIVDLLQIKIEQAKAKLPVETLNAIATIDWRAAILGMREKKGYTFEQLGDLELETELLLCGLLNPADYPKELENRMRIPKGEAAELVNEMNDLVFKKIREELIKNAERKKIFAKNTAREDNNTELFKSHGIEILGIPPLLNKEGNEGGFLKNSPHPDPLLVKERGNALPMPEKLELEATHPILAQKISGSLQTPTVKTEYSLNNISKTSAPNPVNIKNKIPNVDPYREIPE